MSPANARPDADPILPSAIVNAGSLPPWTPATRYPDAAIRSLAPAFDKLRLSSAAVERLASGFRWSEGPVWFGDFRSLLWSDVPGNRILRWDEETGKVSIFRQPSNHANGLTRDRQGRLIACEHLGRRVTRTEYDGSITVLAERHQGKRLNSPNDVVVRSDGSVWFTDPPFGLRGDYEGEPADQELPTNLYRIDPVDGSLTVMADDIDGPNGLAFSPDEKRLYVVESLPRPRNLVVYEVMDDGRRLGRRRLLRECGQGAPDGLRVDVHGNLWCGWGTSDHSLDGVLILDAEGEPIGQIALPERCANLCFGGPRRNRLFMAASQSLYSLYVNTRGVPGG